MEVQDKQEENNKLNVTKLRSFTASRWQAGRTHGVEHWDRVARFGYLLWEEGVDLDVIMAFAYLHDAERDGDGDDYLHGPKASKLVDVIRDTLLRALTDEQIEKLKQACEQHTIAHRTGDITIDTCFDADRMDLPRVGITPLPDKMATKKGAQLVGIPDYADFYAKFKKGEV